ncbi:hypothetical protein SSPO_020690 [Streptomyces antimycoticus]|uniref:Uncharacterized protein n=1 Tax=Streptomyces antimycoticus TaxID=68175 RepID=A0A499UQ78_9ACTN|nr:hypothetical protein SSPO_020690 [Streptomyces antimycoticus]
MRVRALRRAAADALGDQPSSIAVSRMRARVASDSRPLSLNAWDTAAVDTPAAAATCLMVGRRPCFTVGVLTP